jgi:hypothetical protein
MEPAGDDAPLSPRSGLVSVLLLLSQVLQIGLLIALVLVIARRIKP